MVKRAWIVGGALLVGLGGGLGLGHRLFAQQVGVTRTVLQTTDVPGSTTHEAVMAIAEIAPGATLARHRHPGIEIAYLMQGTLVVEHEGRPPVTLTAGQSFKNDAAHNAINSGSTPVKILAVYLVEKGKPLAEPAPLR